MEIIEIVLFILALSLCIITSKSDIKEGLIYNKVLFPYFCVALLIDIVFYGFFRKDLLVDFIGNIIILAITSLILFYSHSFAGGDCKLIIVLALLYPAGSYYHLNENPYTLYFALGIGIFWGYVYLLCNSIHAVIRKKNTISIQYIKGYLLSFLKSFFSGMIYITFINCLTVIGSSYGLLIDAWIIRFLCLAVAWTLGKYPVLRKWYFVSIVFIIDLVLCLITKFFPVNLHPENYILVVILLLCQIVIRTNLYETVSIDSLKKGMILSAQSSIIMQNSRVKGMPGISLESLKNRLTEEEAASVQRWAKYRKISSITIVKKIPFAVFISLGFLSYFIIWSTL